ncbi:ABC transporter permease [Brackiella oedipodis]|uniref:ABC transporter permease n=1 Tax=Brackiella oedipodis TaxID=124225 RepID=UPI000571DD07|nr:ABC transporter permease [Brackiella oedipodis]
MFFKTTLEEFWYAIKHPHQWFLLAWFDIKQRYRRSFLGPFWITISTAVFILTMGVLWSTIFQMDTRDYLPHFAIGNIIWVLIATQLNEAARGFSLFENVIKQHRLPYPSYILRIMSRNVIILAHNLVIIVAVVFYSNAEWTWKALIALPGAAILIVATYLVSLIVAILCTRYRDLVPIIENVVTIAYFLTPILWKPSILPEKVRWVVDLNPAANLLDLVRKPLLDEYPSALNWWYSIGVCILIGYLAYWLLSKTRSRISYWL